MLGELFDIVEILSHLPGHVVLANSSVEVLYVNQLPPGLTQEMVYGRSLIELGAPSERKRLEGIYHSILNTGETVNYNVEGLSEKGVTSVYRCCGSRIKGKNGEKYVMVHSEILDFSTELTFVDKLPHFDQIGDKLVQEAMKRTGNNQSKAAGLLGLTKQAVNQRWKRIVETRAKEATQDLEAS